MPLFDAESSAAEDDAGGVSGSVFLDKNGNGVRDAGEPGFGGVGVALSGHTRQGETLYLTTRTDAQGHYAFPGARIGQGSTFTVTTGGVPLAAAVPGKYSAARTFYVATDGNDKNPGSRERPFRTIGKAVPLLVAGDVLYIRQGEYREYVSSMNRPIGGGQSWDRPIVVAGVPGETVVVKPPKPCTDLLINLTFQRQQYLVFENLVLDAEDVTQPYKSQSRDGKEPPPCHIRLLDCELMHAEGSAVFALGDDHQFINCRIHDNGHSRKAHGLYISSSHNLIQGCDIYRNAGWGIHFYNGSEPTACDSVIRGNRVHDNDVSGTGSPCIGLHTGAKNLVYDNVIWSNPRGIVVSINGVQESIFNNTIYGCEAGGIIIMSDSETHDNVVRNNIVIGSHNPQIYGESKSTVIDHNLTSGAPLFRDAAALDFHLQAASPAIGAGVNIPEVRYDHDGIARPQGKACDLGAYEHSADTFLPTTHQHSELYLAGQKFQTDIGFATK